MTETVFDVSEGVAMNAPTVNAPKAVWVRLKPDQFARLQTLADADDRPTGAMARRLLLDALTRMENPRESEGMMR